MTLTERTQITDAAIAESHLAQTVRKGFDERDHQIAVQNWLATHPNPTQNAKK